jgi:hypothetical protein
MSLVHLIGGVKAASFAPCSQKSDLRTFGAHCARKAGSATQSSQRFFLFAALSWVGPSALSVMHPELAPANQNLMGD